jgi:hypothetical protein
MTAGLQRVNGGSASKKTPSISLNTYSVTWAISLPKHQLEIDSILDNVPV